MKYKRLADDSTSDMSKKRSFGLKKLLYVCAALVLLIAVFISSTFSWFVSKDSANIKSDPFVIEAGDGLRVNEGEDLTNNIILDNITLEEASSVDGRNFFLPTKGTFTSNTDEMTFREGTAGDKNVKYWCKDFTLHADSETTYIYVKNYKVQVGDQTFDGSTKILYDSSGKPYKQEKHKPCPVRVAFITDSGIKPIVIDPTAIINNYVKVFNAVDTIDENGKPTTAQTSAESFTEYYYGTGQPIFTLLGTKPLDVTMVVWLEGTGDNWDYYAGKKISVDIELESNWKDMEPIRFVDDTVGDNGKAEDGHWIQGSGANNCIILMSYKDSNTVKTVVMDEIDNTHWLAYLPKSVLTDISFYRYSISDETIYNAWHTKADINNELNDTSQEWVDSYKTPLQESRTVDGKNETVYTALRGNGYGSVPDDDPLLDEKRLSPCVGYWGKVPSGSGGGGGGGGDTGDCRIEVNLEVPDNHFIRGDLDSSYGTANYDMYVYFTVNGTTDKYKMNYSNGKCTYTGQFPVGAILNYFQAINKYDGTDKGRISTTPITITGDYTYNFKMADNNALAANRI